MLDQEIIEPPKKRKRDYAAETRQAARRYYFGRLEIIEKLGGKCAECGTKGSKKNKLELDHIHGRDWQPKKKSRWMRLVIYRREAAEGKLQVLCSKCNKKKGYSGDGRVYTGNQTGSEERGQTA